MIYLAGNILAFIVIGAAVVAALVAMSRLAEYLHGCVMVLVHEIQRHGWNGKR